MTKGSSTANVPPHESSGFEADRRLVLVSFDIDGTLEDGDPPGPLPMSIARRALDLGYVVGSASDRTLHEQARMWVDCGISPDFVSHKHTLGSVAERFPTVRRVHIGDTHVDAHYARLAGFEFVMATSVPQVGSSGWIF
jgi:hydroxymethylpyrimidine pyrophosphatase-like HAD family hydrolase